jgi:glutamyl-tRNA synthetase
LHIRNLTVPDLAARVKPFFEKAGYVVEDDRLIEVTLLIQQRIVTLEDAPEMGGFFFEDEVNPDPEDLVGKKMTPAQSATAAQRAYQVLEEEPEITHETTETQLRTLADELDLSAGQLFGILRAAVTGRKVSPPLFQTMAVFGKDTVLERIEDAIRTLETMELE